MPSRIRPTTHIIQPSRTVHSTTSRGTVAVAFASVIFSSRHTETMADLSKPRAFEFHSGISHLKKRGTESHKKRERQRKGVGDEMVASKFASVRRGVAVPPITIAQALAAGRTLSTKNPMSTDKDMNVLPPCRCRTQSRIVVCKSRYMLLLFLSIGTEPFVACIYVA